jgi:hypothetical protein
VLYYNELLYYSWSNKTLVANTSWIVTLEQDENGELLLPFPSDLLAQMGWSEGTDLFWIDNEDGTFSLKENKNESSET